MRDSKGSGQLVHTDLAISLHQHLALPYPSASPGTLWCSWSEQVSQFGSPCAERGVPFVNSTLLVGSCTKHMLHGSHSILCILPKTEAKPHAHMLDQAARYQHTHLCCLWLHVFFFLQTEISVHKSAKEDEDLPSLPCMSSAPVVYQKSRKSGLGAAKSRADHVVLRIKWLSLVSFRYINLFAEVWLSNCTWLVSWTFAWNMSCISWVWHSHMCTVSAACGGGGIMDNYYGLSIHQVRCKGWVGPFAKDGTVCDRCAEVHGALMRGRRG